MLRDGSYAGNGCKGTPYRLGLALTLGSLRTRTAGKNLAAAALGRICQGRRDDRRSGKRKRFGR
jgi:hypothetical protein